MLMGRIKSYHKFPILLHVVNGIQFHRIRIQFPRRIHTSRALDLFQTSFQGEQLVVYGQQRLADGFGGNDVLIDESVALPEQIEQCALGVQICWTALCIDEVSVDSRFVYAVELSLVGIEIGLAERPRLSEVHLFEGVFDLEELVIGVLEALIDLALPATDF